MVSEDITLDQRVHARIIGGRGKAIRKIMDEFKASTLRGLFLDEGIANYASCFCETLNLKVFIPFPLLIENVSRNCHHNF